MLGKVGEFLSGLKSKVEADPQLYEAMMMTAAGLMQSPKPGENALDPVGRAMQGGIGYLRQLREQEKARAAQTQKDQRSYELDSRRTDLYGQQVQGQNDASLRNDENADLLRAQQERDAAADRASREKVAGMQSGATIRAAGIRADGSLADEPKIFGMPISHYQKQVKNYARLYGLSEDDADFALTREFIAKMTPAAVATRLNTPGIDDPRIQGLPVPDASGIAAQISQPQVPGYVPPEKRTNKPLPYKPGQKANFTLPGMRDPVQGTVVQRPDGTLAVDVGGKLYKITGQ